MMHPSYLVACFLFILKILSELVNHRSLPIFFKQRPDRGRCISCRFGRKRFFPYPGRSAKKGRAAHHPLMMTAAASFYQ